MSGLAAAAYHIQKCDVIRKVDILGY